MNTYTLDKMYESYADTVERMQMWLDESEQENKELKEHIEKYEHYCKTTGIEELMKENKKYKEVIKEIIEYLQSKEFEENFPYVANECQVRSAILNIVVERIMTADFNKLLDMLKGEE